MDRTDAVRKKLQEMAEPAYRDFSAALVPGCANMLGVRLPLLRKLAKALDEESVTALLAEEKEIYFEETMLKGMLIASRRMPLEKRLELTAWFLPRIVNWSLCDSFCVSFHPKQEEREPLWQFFSPYAAAQEEFFVRFAVVMAMDHYLGKEDLPCTLGLLKAANTGAGYYARMGVAWAVSMAYVRYPAETLPLLQNRELDEETTTLAVKKICESRKTDQTQKNFLKTLKYTEKEETV